VPLKVYDESIGVLRRALAAAKVGRSDKLDGMKRLDTLLRDRGQQLAARRFEATIAQERIEALHPIQFVGAADLRSRQRAAQHPDRFVARPSKRHGEGMAVFAAMRERKPSGILEPRRRAVDHFRDERERLQRARAELLEEQERREVAQVALVRECQHRRRALRVHVGLADVVMDRHLEPPHVLQRMRRILARDREATRPAQEPRVRRRDCGLMPCDSPTIAVCDRP